MAAPAPGPLAPGPYLQTVSGRWVNPFDPDPHQLDPCALATERRTFGAFAERYAELDARR